MESSRLKCKCICGAALLALSILTPVTGGNWSWAAESPQAAQSQPGPAPRIVNGQTTFDFPAVGALLYGDQLFRALVCSGTMIGCRTFLTAAHCVCPTIGAQCQPGELFAPDVASHFVYLQNAGLLPVSSIALPPTYSFPDDDVAVVTLAEEATSITPAENSSEPPVLGATGTIVGFGRTGGNPVTNVDFGIKRAGPTTLEACNGNIDPQKSICWNYTGGSEANTCNGDSGGPIFMDYGSGEVVAGVTSGGDSATCLELDFSFDANVFNYLGFISAAAGSDILSTACGSPPAVQAPSTAIFAASGRIADGDVLYPIVVPSGTERLVFTMNGIDDGIEDFDLYVKFGGSASTTDFDCSSTFSGQFESCSFSNPAAGTWSALVHPYAGYGEFQFTATALGPKPCLDAAECDDGNPCTDELCTGGFCSYSGNSAPCDDGLFCNGTDNCSGGLCSLHNGDPCSGGFCVEPYGSCMIACPGSCGSELADKKQAKAVEKFVKKRARALLRCTRRNDPTCPESCPVPDGSILGLSQGCQDMLACRVDEIVAVFYQDPYGGTWNQSGFCSASPASKCGVARAKQGFKLIRKTLRRYRTGKLSRIGDDLNRCRARVDRKDDCGGPSLCFASSTWANALVEQ